MLIIILSVLPISAYADFGNVIDRHWASEYMDKEFVDRYFPMYKEDDYKNMKLDALIRNDYFYETLIKVVKNNVDTNIAKTAKVELKTTQKPITRNEAARYIVEVLKGYGRELPKELSTLPFVDTKELVEKDIEYVGKVFKADFMKGYTVDRFVPEGNLSLAEGVIILQRLNDYLNRNELLKSSGGSIPFKLTDGNEKNEGIKVDVKDNRIWINITKEFPTSGYRILVNGIARDKLGDYWIYLKVKSPKITDAVVEKKTYETVVIELNKDDLQGKTYQFKLDWAKY